MLVITQSIQDVYQRGPVIGVLEGLGDRRGWQKAPHLLGELTAVAFVVGEFVDALP